MAKKRIGIISNNNGWGLSKDIGIVQQILSNKYIESEYKYFYSNDLSTKYDMQIHNELIGGRLMNNAKYNVLVPNPEWLLPDRKSETMMWFHESPRRHRFIATLCKTKHAIPIFQKMGMKNVVFTGFTTASKLADCGKKIPEFLHIAGASIFKNTERIVDVWNEFADLPKLHLFSSHLDMSKRIKTDNIEFHYGRKPVQVITEAQNKILYHIQPSQTEGFGHVLWETLSCGGILITLNAPPMNELYSLKIDKAFKVGQQGYGTLFGFHPEEAYKTIQKALNMSNKELNGMQIQGRQLFLRNDIEFRQKFYDIIKDILHDKYQ